ncbi:MAG: enediyne biosynthesis thioesterase [Lentisphaeria bacterium]|jgi:enediyne biosynthesis thioesterase
MLHMHLPQALPHAAVNQLPFPLVEPEPPKTFTTQFLTSLKHSNATQNVYFANYFEWQGQARELWFVECIAADFLADAGVFVTSNAHNNFFREAFPFETVECRVNVFNIKKCSFSIHFNFLIDGEISAEGYQNIAFTSHDKKIKALPREILDKIRQYEAPCHVDETPLKLPASALAPLRHTRNKRYFTEFRTTLKHSNATQNVYFSNYFDWQGAAREQWFFDRIDPTMLQNEGVFVTAIADNQFIKEALPFQVVRCEVYSFSIQRCAFHLGFDFYIGEELISKGYQKIVFANHEKRIARLPADVLAKVAEYERV